MELIQAVWSGRVPLWKACLLFAVVVFGVPSLVDLCIDWAIRSSMFRLEYARLLLAIAIILSYFVIVGVWRSATNYTGNVAWPILVKLAVVVGFVRLLLLVAHFFGLV